MPVFDLTSDKVGMMKWAVSYAMSNIHEWIDDDETMTEEAKDKFYLELAGLEEILASTSEITVSTEREEI